VDKVGEKKRKYICIIVLAAIAVILPFAFNNRLTITTHEIR